MIIDSLFETNGTTNPNVVEAKKQQFQPLAMSSPIQNYGAVKDNNNYYVQGQAKNKSSKVNTSNLNPLLKSLSNNLLKGLVITSGNDSKHMKGSKHYTNKAFDIGANSSDKVVYNQFKEMLKNPTYKKSLMTKYNIQDIIDEGDHLHIEQVKMGGKIKKHKLGDPNPTGTGVGINTSYYSNKRFGNMGTVGNSTKAGTSIVGFDNKNTGSTNQSNLVGIGSQLANLGSSFIDSTNDLENPNVTKSTLSGALGGAATGASLGSAIPVIGTAVGAVIGGVVGLIGANKKAKKAKEEFQTKQKSIDNNYMNNTRLSTQARLSAFPSKGNSDINYYKFGGILKYKNGGKNVIQNGKPMFKRQDDKVVKRGLWSNTYLSKKAEGGELEMEEENPMYEAERGEIIIGNDVQGNSKEISQGIHEVQGKSHDEANPKSVNGTGEDFTGGNFIFSNYLKPNGKETFAQIAKKIAMKNKPNPRMKNSQDYIYLNTIQANEQIKQAELEQLAQIQEAMKEQSNIQQMRFGGIIKMKKAGVPPTREEAFLYDLLNNGKNAEDLKKLGYETKTINSIVSKYNNNRDYSANTFPKAGLDDSKSWDGMTKGIVDLKKVEVKPALAKQNTQKENNVVKAGIKSPFSLNKSMVKASEKDDKGLGFHLKDVPNIRSDPKRLDEYIKYEYKNYIKGGYSKEEAKGLVSRKIKMANGLDSIGLSKEAFNNDPVISKITDSTLGKTIKNKLDTLDKKMNSGSKEPLFNLKSNKKSSFANTGNKTASTNKPNTGSTNANGIKLSEDTGKPFYGRDKFGNNYENGRIVSQTQIEKPKTVANAKTSVDKVKAKNERMKETIDGFKNSKASDLVEIASKKPFVLNNSAIENDIKFNRNALNLIGNNADMRFDNGKRNSNALSLGTDEVDDNGNKNKQPSKFSEFLRNNSEDLTGLASIGANYMTNRNSINKMNTNVDVALNEAPDYQYRQRNALANHDIMGNMRVVNNSVTATQGTKQNVYANILNNLNQSNEQEAQRKFEYQSNYLNAVSQNKNQNNQMIANANNQMIQNRNQQIALQSDNNNQLFQNINTFTNKKAELVANKENMKYIASSLASRLNVDPSLINAQFLSGQGKFGGIIRKKY